MKYIQTEELNSNIIWYVIKYRNINDRKGKGSVGQKKRLWIKIVLSKVSCSDCVWVNWFCFSLLCCQSSKNQPFLLEPLKFLCIIFRLGFLMLEEIGCLLSFSLGCQGVAPCVRTGHVCNEGGWSLGILIISSQFCGMHYWQWSLNSLRLVKSLSGNRMLQKHLRKTIPCCADCPVLLWIGIWKVIENLSSIS